MRWVHHSYGRDWDQRLRINKWWIGVVRGSAQYFRRAGLMLSMSEALFGSKLCNAWNTSAVEMSMLDRVSLQTGRSALAGKSYEEWVNTKWKNWLNSWAWSKLEEACLPSNAQCMGGSDCWIKKKYTCIFHWSCWWLSSGSIGIQNLILLQPCHQII